MIWRSAKSRKKCHKEMVIDTSAQTKFSREFGANKNVIFQFSDNEENYLWILKSKQWKVLYGLINDLKYVLQTNKWTNIIKDDKKQCCFCRDQFISSLSQYKLPLRSVYYICPNFASKMSTNIGLYLQTKWYD